MVFLNVLIKAKFSLIIFLPQMSLDLLIQEVMSLHLLSVSILSMMDNAFHLLEYLSLQISISVLPLLFNQRIVFSLNWALKRLYNGVHGVTLVQLIDDDERPRGLLCHDRHLEIVVLETEGFQVVLLLVLEKIMHFLAPEGLYYHELVVSGIVQGTLFAEMHLIVEMIQEKAFQQFVLRENAIKDVHLGLIHSAEALQLTVLEQAVFDWTIISKDYPEAVKHLFLVAFL